LSAAQGEQEILSVVETLPSMHIWHAEDPSWFAKEPMGQAIGLIVAGVGQYLPF
jgi:hypothetical protein